MSQTNPSVQELEAYCTEYMNTKDQTKAWLTAFPESTAKPETVHTNASRFHKIPKVRARIAQLSAIAVNVASEKFSITVEQRLRWLKDIAEAGMGTYADSTGSLRRESLTAARSAIETMNTMLGTKEESDEVIKPIPIGVVDAS